MDRPRVIYVCMPFRAKTAQLISDNIQAAVDNTVVLQKFGFYPLCPHLLSERWPSSLTLRNEDFWLKFTLEIMRRCDVVFCGPGWERSSGCLGEVAEARRLGIPVVIGLREAFDYTKTLGGK